MIQQSIAQGYTEMDNCYKYIDPDSTIECYSYTREALKAPIKTKDPELNTNAVYILVGKEDEKIKAYVGKASKPNNPANKLNRVRQHLKNSAKEHEKYYPYWKKALVFVCKNAELNSQWTTAIIEDLEAILIKDTQNEYSWNSNQETIKNPLSTEIIRSHARKRLDIKEYVNYFGYTFLNEVEQPVNNESLTYDEKLSIAEKEMIDKTVEINTVNLDPDSKIPEYTTCEKVVNQMLDLLPWDEFDETTKFLDPACKGGEFLVLIHDRMLKQLRESSFLSNVPEPERTIRIHHHIVDTQLFGIAIGEKSNEIAKKRVYKSNNIVQASSRYVDYLKSFYSAKTKEEYTSEQIAKAVQLMIDKEFNNDMKFDVVIGNPPYQEDTVGGGTKTRGLPLYDKFIFEAQQLADTVSMITPVRWYTQPEKSFIELRNTMLNGQLEEMVDYKDSVECFSNSVNIAGGVSYWLWRRDRKGPMHVISGTDAWYAQPNKKNIFIRDKVGHDIVSKMNYNVERTFDAVVFGTDMFGVKREPSGIEHADAIHTVKLIHSSNFNKKYARGIEEYIDQNIIKKNAEYISAYKVYTEYMNGSGDTVLKSVNILQPNEICDLSFIVIDAVNDKEVAENIQKYFKTKFVRFLIKITLTNTTATKDNYCLVPIQEFESINHQKCNEIHKIDWSQSIADIDKQLYKKYNLSDEEIAYIESTIKPME